MNLTSNRFLLKVLIVIPALVGVSLSIRQSQVKGFQVGVVPGSLEALAQTTLSEGENSADVPMPLYEYGSAEGITDAFSKYSVVVAHPVSSSSSVWDSENQIIGTWYKFVIDETLSSRPFPVCDTCQASPSPPSSLTASTNELLIPKFGGVVTINGVTLTSNDPNFPSYQPSQSYLLFLEVDSTKRVGLLGAGPIAAFSVSSTGVLTPVTQMPSLLADQIAQTYGNSLSAIRTTLTGSTPTPTPTPTPCSVANQVINACTNNGGLWDPATCTCN